MDDWDQLTDMTILDLQPLDDLLSIRPRKLNLHR